MKTIGFLAVDQYGQMLKLTKPTSPRKQLLEAMGRKHAGRIFVETISGDSKHVGWIVASRWFNVYRVCPLNER